MPWQEPSRSIKHNPAILAREVKPLRRIAERTRFRVRQFRLGKQSRSTNARTHKRTFYPPFIFPLPSPSHSVIFIFILLDAGVIQWQNVSFPS